MRGEHRLEIVKVTPSVGIIPACAGSTESSDSTPMWSPGSSPHARGARYLGAPASARSEDHPRMRGEHDVFADARLYLGGIIPACAGSTKRLACRRISSSGSSPHARGAPWCCRGRAASRGDHPRMRGEHEKKSLDEQAVERDHPRMRGEHPSALAPSLWNPRIIPACAGSTTGYQTLMYQLGGSSPHARGARYRPRRDT